MTVVGEIVVDERLEQAERLCADGAWADALALLAGVEDLSATDLERLATAAALTGDDELAASSWERAHHGWLDRGDVPRAVRSACWLGLGLARRGRMAPAAGWFGRGRRLLDESGITCAEDGRLLVPVALATIDHDSEEALAIFDRIRSIGREHDDREVFAFGLLGSGRCWIELGDAAKGMALLDEAMVTVTTDEVNPLLVGIVYCAVILQCHLVFDLRRAREWTEELDRWSSGLQGLVPFRGQCLVHRSEMAQLRGDWDMAVQEADHACAHLGDPAGDPALGLALYQRGELHRVRGEYDLADAAFERAVALGHHDVPGRALVLLGRGRVQDAARVIRLAEQDAGRPVQQARVLAAHVEIMVAAGALAEARAGAARLRELAAALASPMLAAASAHAAGIVGLADGEAAVALRELDAASAGWLELGALHEAARSEVALAQACATLGDHDRAAVVRRRARRIFEGLGAEPDLDRLDATGEPSAAAAPGGPGGQLSPRECEVVILLARGLTNRQVAEELVISEKTVARHVSNIFTKLGVQTRSAAGAWAFQHGLVD